LRRSWSGSSTSGSTTCPGHGEALGAIDTLSRRSPKGTLQIGHRLERAIEHHTDVEHEIERGEDRGEEVEPRRGGLRRNLFWLSVTASSLYLVAPSLIETLGSWDDLATIAPAWLGAMAAFQTASFACLWALQRLAMRVRGWYEVVTSQMAGSALARIAPGGGAVGAALQYRLLVQAGVTRANAIGGLTAANLLTFGVVLALPVLAVPSLIRGGVSRSLVEGTVIGVIVFVALLAASAALLAFDRPLAWVGRTIQRIRNRLRPHAEPLTQLPRRLLRERDRILSTLGPRWRLALLATVARWAFEYATLLAALAAVGSHPRPGLVLLAFCIAQVLTQVPVTPGGLGFVEAGLTATLTLAGVSAGDAVLATFAYRLFTYWLPLPLGLAALVLHRRRYAAGAYPEQGNVS
jgi:putative heme transporter